MTLRAQLLRKTIISSQFARVVINSSRGSNYSLQILTFAARGNAQQQSCGFLGSHSNFTC
jgi:hypothetical protein